MMLNLHNIMVNMKSNIKKTPQWTMYICLVKVSIHLKVIFIAFKI